MKVVTEPTQVIRHDGSPLHPSGWASDADVIQHEDKLLLVCNYPLSNGTTAIAIAESSISNGVTFLTPKVVLRPIPGAPGMSRGVETSCLVPPSSGFPYWMLFAMTYTAIPNRPTDHWSVVSIALANDYLGPYTWIDVVVAPTYMRQQPHSKTETGPIDGGLSELVVMKLGGTGALAGLVATNSYRPKPCIYAAASLPPWAPFSWTMSPKPVLEGEGAMWASQPHLSVTTFEAVCVYAEGPPERIRVARGPLDLSSLNPAEILIEPTPGTPWEHRAFGPSLVGNRLYFTAVDNAENKVPWRIMTALVDL